MALLLNGPKCTGPYYIKTVEPIEKWGHTQYRWTPTNQGQVYRALLHQTSRTYWEMRMPFPTNKPQVYPALLHQNSRTYWKWQGSPLLIELKHTEAYYTKPVELLRNEEALLLNGPKCTEAYYTKPVELIEKWGGPSPLINPKCTHPYYTKPVELLRMRPYPVQRVLPLFEPKCTESYYTKPVEPVEKWGGPPTNWALV